MDLALAVSADPSFAVAVQTFDPDTGERGAVRIEADASKLGATSGRMWFWGARDRLLLVAAIGEWEMNPDMVDLTELFRRAQQSLGDRPEELEDRVAQVTTMAIELTRGQK